MMSARLMRAFLPSRLLPRLNAIAKPAATHPAALSSPCDPRACLESCRCFADIHEPNRHNRNVWFTSSTPRLNNDHRPPDARTLQLGRTVRTLHERLPSLLLSPLPSEILSPQISLHLFPSTHPHLPSISGRIGYVAALWTAPVAWGRIPLVGNVRLDILSERMVRNGGSTAVPLASRDEKLIVKWKTCGKQRVRVSESKDARDTITTPKDPVDKIKEFISGAGEMKFFKQPSGEEQEFCGIFIFEFDDEGRIAKHVIEHTEESGRFDHMTRVVSVTDWLLGRFNGKKDELPALALCEEPSSGRASNIVSRRRSVD
ncbi:hypothetical protein BDY17DRAFT_306008 [Neohortaea acidophila]|uniref:Uncharacterized protein n=1 Tax=Neohortaea acidophila TaxID=245834 RepID=A0A6A6PI01_9PEZI|nr:uncharacterized protein BDY17DRAFT_306008 [Neohortaea acidophila]KAF2478897.1 hypothetical protein BDY17DRAFT_306008 [Neohortaea acidophila]